MIHEAAPSRSYEIPSAEDLGAAAEWTIEHEKWDWRGIDYEAIQSPLLKRAIAYAMWAHEGQVRKVYGAPYMTHCLDVLDNYCAIVGIDPHEIRSDNEYETAAIAAVMHDSLEDAPDRVTPQLLVGEFGANVRDLVIDLTKDPNLISKSERNLKAVMMLGQSPRVESTRIKIADALDGLVRRTEEVRDLGLEVSRHFSTKFEEQIEYYASIMMLAADKFGHASPEYGLLAHALSGYIVATGDTLENREVLSQGVQNSIYMIGVNAVELSRGVCIQDPDEFYESIGAYVLRSKEVADLHGMTSMNYAGMLGAIGVYSLARHSALRRRVTQMGGDDVLPYAV